MRSSMLLLALAGCLVGCIVDSDYEPPPQFPCDSSADNADVAGTWIITGSGTRTDCQDDERLDTTLFTLGSVAITVSQNITSLKLVSPTNSGSATLTLTNGIVDGTCVDFELTELGGKDGKIKYEFAGAMKSNGEIIGIFDGDGPESCDSDGSFTIRIQP